MTRAHIQGRLDIDSVTYGELLAHARSDHPYEVCGLLAIRDGRVEWFRTIRNAERSMTHYRMDAGEMGPAYIEIDQDDGLELGVFHSHTHSEAFPSPTDVEEAAWHPQAVFLIASLQREPAVIRAFDIVDGRITERELFVDGAPAAPVGAAQHAE